MRVKEREPRVEVRRRRLKDGRVSEAHSVRYWDAEGVRRRVTCESREHAELERARLALEYRQVGRIGAPRAGMTVAEFWPSYRSDALMRLAEVTVRGYDGTWRRYVEPRFGAVAMDRIVPRDISQWRADLHRRGVGREAVRLAMVLLQAMFTLAIEWGEATANPVSVVRKPRQGRQRAVEVVDPMSVERIRTWMLDRGDIFSATLVSVLAYAGVRPGEALALEARHVRTETLLVEQAVSYGKLKRQKTGRIYRTVDVLEALREDLDAWLPRVGGTGPLFARADGGWFGMDDWNNWRNRRFYATLDDLGMKRARPYDLRHSFASLLIREGRVSIVELAEQLGHSPTETLKTYGHVFAEYRRAERVPADELIRRARS